jgi:hypothetical protein
MAADRPNNGRMAVPRQQYIIKIEKEGLVALQSRLAYMDIPLSPMQILDADTHYSVLPMLCVHDAVMLVERGYTVRLNEPTLNTSHGQLHYIRLDHQ